jgi:hypothetical protein
MVRVFGFLPPILGGWGGECRVEREFLNSLSEQSQADVKVIIYTILIL